MSQLWMHAAFELEMASRAYSAGMDLIVGGKDKERYEYALTPTWVGAEA